MGAQRLTTGPGPACDLGTLMPGFSFPLVGKALSGSGGTEGSRCLEGGSSDAASESIT